MGASGFRVFLHISHLWLSPWRFHSRRHCRRCPQEIRENLEVMKRNKMGPDGKKHDKPKHGGRKVFFHRLWCRIQGLEIEEIGNVEVKMTRF